MTRSKPEAWITIRPLGFRHRLEPQLLLLALRLKTQLSPGRLQSQLLTALIQDPQATRG